MSLASMVLRGIFEWKGIFMVDINTGGLSRRGFLIAGGAAAAVAVVGCSTNGDGAATAAATAAASDLLGSPKPDQKYYWVTANIADPFYRDGIAGMEEFGKLYGVQTEIVGPQTADVAGMVKAFEETLAKPDCSGIFSYFYSDFSSAQSLYEKAYEMGIPIVNGAADWGGPRIGWCGVIDGDAAKKAMEVIQEAYPNGAKVGFIGNTGLNIQREEQEYARLTEELGLGYVGNVAHDGSAEDAVRQYAAFVGANSDVEVMFFADGLGPSVVQGLADSGPNVKIILRGLGQNGLDAIKGGDQVIATIDRSPFDEEFWGFPPLYFAVNGGYRGPEQILVPQVIVTKDNVDGFLTNPYRDSKQWN
ncbi:MAG: substrate-binding domain-containing protein [Bacteroidetes bacterium]|nr:substrate-binding domain-containing protein [Bacteroidota bacterium]